VNNATKCGAAEGVPCTAISGSVEYLTCAEKCAGVECVT
jgi:hypothetical protein